MVTYPAQPNKRTLLPNPPPSDWNLAARITRPGNRRQSLFPTQIRASIAAGRSHITHAAGKSLSRSAFSSSPRSSACSWEGTPCFTLLTGGERQGLVLLPYADAARHHYKPPTTPHAAARATLRERPQSDTANQPIT